VVEANPPTDNPRAERLRRALMVALIVAAGLVIAVASVELIPLWFVPFHSEPSDFAPAGVGSVGAGTIGCAPISDEVCYFATFQSLLEGLTLSHLRFRVANSSASSPNGPEAPALPLGSSARVSVLASPMSVAGVWNVSTAQWISGSTWNVPIGTGTTVILDTDLSSNRTLENAEFYVILTSPFEGAVGFPLWCGGC